MGGGIDPLKYSSLKNVIVQFTHVYTDTTFNFSSILIYSLKHCYVEHLKHLAEYFLKFCIYFGLHLL